MPTKTPKQRYLLIDGNALVHRGFHAIPALSTKDGEPTNAVFGFVSILLRAIKDLKPTHIACTFDLAGPTFRHEEYADYKGTRVKGADELYAQFPRVKEVVAALNIPIFEKAGFEADDLLGTLSKQICEQNEHGCDVMIATGDLDTLQLVNKCVKIYTLRKGLNDTAIYDEAAILERFGLKPIQMIDYKALRGDPSDNIKGVKGIGEKTAGELIQTFGSLDELYEAIKNPHRSSPTGEGQGGVVEKIKPRIFKLLVDGEEDARFSYMLSKIVTDVPVEINLEPYTFTSKNLDQIVKIFQELEFKSLLDKLPKNYIAVKDVLETETTPAFGHPSSRGGEGEGIGKQDYQLIDTDEKLQKLLPKLAKLKELVLDTETDQLNPIDAQVIGVSLAVKAGEAYYITFDVVKNNAEFIKLLADKKLAKVGQNIKYDFQVLKNSNIELSPVAFDTMIASYILNAGTRQHGLDNLAFTMLGYQMQSIEELIGKGKSQISMKDVDVEKVSWYAAEDADITLRIKQILEKELKEQNLEKIFYDFEMPLIPVLARMERCGIKVDAKLLGKLSKQAGDELINLEQEIYKQAGEEFNIGSPKQLQEILYTKLELTSGKKIKTGLSTAAGQLERMRLEHPIVDMILQYRELSKLKSTYLDSLPELINKTTGRIHTNYNQTIAATGRLSSTDPNLQNIPIRGTGLGSEVRKAFVAKEGFKLVSLDYSQIELRIVAHLAQDENMLTVFKNNQDIHTNTAMGVFDVTADEVTPDMRRDAKVINFGILYGLSSFGLTARISEVSQGAAKDFIDKYFATYPEVQAFLEKTKMQVREDGFVTNEVGRVRKFPESQSSQFFIRQAAERAAVNFPIQSLSADIIKKAMIEIDALIPPPYEEGSGEVTMLLQVHDELVFEIREDTVEKWIKKLKPIMEGAIKLSVPVLVESKVGDNWGDMEKLK